MLAEKLGKYHIILASKSPRRQYLLKEMGVDFEIRNNQVDEHYPEHLKREEIALYLSELKAASFKNIRENELLITSDTIVWIHDHILHKPKDYKEAVKMLNLLSGNMHEVVSGVSLKTKEQSRSFHSVTKVYFKKLLPEEIRYYLENFKPYDKAGSYGIQEWIGYIGIEKIEGSYFNVMGLPVQRLYQELMNF